MRFHKGCVLMNLEEEVIFLAGATGLAGTSLIKAILATCPSVRIRGVYHRTEPFFRDERLEYVKADLTRREECRRAIRGCNYAILAAANTGGAASAVSEPDRQVTDNLVMDALLLEALSLEKVRRTVFVSSSTVYQEFEGRIREEDLDLNQDPHPVYLGVGWAKRAAEKLCTFWSDRYGLEIIIARSSNIFGPFARFDPKRSNFIPALIRKASEMMDPFVVWGIPEVTRDVIYGEDFAGAVVSLLTRTQEGGGVFNVGSGRPTTVADVVKWVLDYSGHRPEEVTYSQGSPTTIKYRVLDCTKIREAVGWEPVFSIEQGIQETVQWWKENRSWWMK